MSNKKDNIESSVLDKYGRYIIQLYKILNRQYDKESAINAIGDFIYKKFGYKFIYFDTVTLEDNKKVAIKNLLHQYNDSDSGDIEYNPFFETLDLQLPIDKYKDVIYLEDEKSIKKMFPRLNEVIAPNILLSVPIFLQEKIIGFLIIYDTYKKKMVPEFRNLIQLTAKELAVVFSRIEKCNLKFRNMLSLAALENVLLYNPEEDQISPCGQLQKIVSALPNITGMKRCTLVLLDKDKKFLTTCYSNYPNPDIEVANKKRKCILNKLKNRDCKAQIAIKTKKPVIVYDAPAELRCSGELVKELGICSIIFLPVLDTKEEPLGVLCLHNGKYETFSKGQVHFLEIIARYIGLMVSNIDYIDDLKTWSKYDGLTNLFNRRAFEDTYKKLYDAYKFSGKKFSVLMIDIDDFKLVNDTYGHQIGDKVLKGVAECIKQNVLGKDIVARYGGEEIIVILRDIDKREARLVADRIRRSIFDFSVDGVSVTVSIGVSTFGIDSYCKEALIYIADRRLYQAKSIGKNQIVGK